MNREYVVWATAVVVFLLGGLLVGRHFMTLPGETDATAFRQWFWESHSLDLVAQVGLIFGGVLGVLAFL